MKSERIELYPTKNSRRLLKVSFLGHIFNDMYWFIIPIALPLIKSEFDLNYTQSGLLVSSYTIIGAFGSLITGYVGDRIGRRFILSWGFLLASVALVLCALSYNYWQLFLSLIILGAGISAFHPSMIAVLSTSFTYKRGTVLGLFQFWGWLGTLIIVMLAFLLIRLFSGWRGMLLILSIPGFVFAPLFFKFLRTLIGENPSHGRKKDKKYSLSVKKTKTSLPLVIFIISNTLFTMTYYGVINFLPTYMVEEKSLSFALASYCIVIVFAGGLLGTITSGKASDKISPLPVLISFVTLGGPTIILITLSHTYAMLLFLLVVLGISYSGIWAPQQAYLAEKTPQSVRGGTYGIIFCLSSIVGAIAPGITGLTADYLGFSNALKISTLPLFISLILLFTLREDK